MNNHTLNRAVMQPRSAADVCDRMAIPYCCEGRKTLIEASSALSLSVDEAMRALSDPEAKNGTVASHAPDTTLEFLVLRVLQAQHDKVKQILPALERLAANAVEHNRVRHPEVAVIEELLQRLSSDLTTHLTDEERNVFPSLLELELTYLGEKPVSGKPTQVRELLHDMSQQHDTSGLTLHRISAESHGFCPPAGADSSCRGFYEELQNFYTDLHQDLHVENDILFPQAARMEAEIFRAP